MPGLMVTKNPVLFNGSSKYLNKERWTIAKEIKKKFARNFPIVNTVFVWMPTKHAIKNEHILILY